MKKKNITNFDTGAIRDSQDGKPDFIETSSPLADWRYANYMTGKKKKYGQGNFKKGIPQSSYLASAARHFVKLRALEDCKTYGNPVEDWMEPHEDHAAAIRFNIDGFMHEDMAKPVEVKKKVTRMLDGMLKDTKKRKNVNKK